MMYRMGDAVFIKKGEHFMTMTYAKNIGNKALITSFEGDMIVAKIECNGEELAFYYDEVEIISLGEI